MSIQELLLQLLGILFVGGAIKLLDDYLDQELDQLLEKKTLAMRLQTSALPYALILLSLASLFIKEMAISLFVASYILGMHTELRKRQPSGLNGFQESFILSLTLLFTIQPKEVITSFSIIFIIQLLDDTMDYYAEPFPGRNNLVKRLGKLKSSILLLILLPSALYFDLMKSLMALLAFPIIIYLMERRYKGEGKEEREWSAGSY